MPDPPKYASERYDPVLAHCTTLTLAFDGSFLTLGGAGKPHRYPAVSGKPSSAGTFEYGSTRQRKGYVGPIPAGTYWVRPDELWTNAWYKQGSVEAWGNHRLTIHPFTKTETFGRGGFFIHGGSTPGSAGCIDLTSHMDTFVADLRAAVGPRSACQIHLVVAYPP